MTQPIRIQRRRSKHWKMPKNTVYVGRGTRWGNPFKIEQGVTTEDVVKKFTAYVLPYMVTPDSTAGGEFMVTKINIKDIQDHLRGKNLACWCRLDQPCHADILLTIANGDMLPKEH